MSIQQVGERAAIVVGDTYGKHGKAHAASGSAGLQEIETAQESQGANAYGDSQSGIGIVHGRIYIDGE